MHEGMRDVAALMAALSPSLLVHPTGDLMAEGVGVGFVGSTFARLGGSIYTRSSDKHQREVRECYKLATCKDATATGSSAPTRHLLRG